jgi:hypothetical protein
MVEQILPNNNESATGIFFPKILPSEHALSPCFRYVRISKLLWLFAMGLFRCEKIGKMDTVAFSLLFGN